MSKQSGIPVFRLLFILIMHTLLRHILSGLFAGVLLFLVCLTGCRKDDGFFWDSRWYGPLAYGELTMGDLLDDSLLWTDNHAVFLGVRRNLFSVSGDSLVTIPDDLGRSSLRLPIEVTVAPGHVLMNSHREHSIDAGDARLTEGRIRRGMITIITKTTYKVPVEYTYEFPGLTKNGVPISITEVVPASDSGTLIVEKDFEFSDYHLDLTGPNNDRYNRLEYHVFAQTTSFSDTTVITPQDSLALAVRFKDLEMEYLKGSFGQPYIEASGEETIDIFENIQSGLLELDSLKSAFHITNGVGADLSLTLYRLSGINNYTHNQVILQSPMTNNAIHISRAAEQGGHIYPFHRTIDMDGSNIRAFTENLPHRIGYELGMKINPMGNISMGNDFFHEKHPLSVDLEMELPLKIKAEDLILSREIDLSIEDMDNLVESGTITIEFTNHFPLDFSISVWAGPDASGPRLSVDGEDILSGAPVDAGGMVTHPAVSSITLNIPASSMKAIKKHGTLLLQACLNTSGMERVQIYDHYRLKYKITGNITVNIHG